MASQEVTQVQAKPNIEILPKFRYSSGQQKASKKQKVVIEGTHSQNLLQFELLHLLTIILGADPFLVDSVIFVFGACHWNRKPVRGK
jgi:hypothetical protein